MAQISSSYPEIMVDYTCCNLCMSCIELYPDVFFLDDVTDKVFIKELNNYDSSFLSRLYSACPRGCITVDQKGI